MAVAAVYSLQQLAEAGKILVSWVALVIAAPFAFVAEILIGISEWIDPDEP